MNKMNLVKYFAVILLAGLFSCCNNVRFTVKSPDGKLSLQLVPDNSGGLFYKVFNGDTEVISTSAMGVTGKDSAWSFVENLTFVKASAKSIDETYQLPTGKVKTYRNQCNEKRYRFRNKAGNEITVECRAYNDGVAFRYIIEKEGNIEIVSENSCFDLPGNATTWTTSHVPHYENFYPKRELSIIGEPLSYPALIQTGNQWLLLTEANVYNHPATHLQKARENSLKVAFPEESFTVSNRYESPWRTFIIGDRLKTIVESTMVENLNPPSVIQDMSWLEPGVAVFPWWGNYVANSSIDTLKMYVDMAAEMNWQWIEFDVALVGEAYDGHPTKEWETATWLKEFTDYAAGKGIKVYGWDGFATLKTKEGRDHVYGRYRDLGIKGIKIDFVDNDQLHAMQFRDVAMKDAIDYGLMVSFHGEITPRGQRRKYPNLMTGEGVRGAEYYTFPRQPAPNSVHNCTLPFTRNAVGSMDYTPCTLTIREENPRTTTYAHELALPFIFESGWVCMADRPKAYLNSPAKEILKKVKATWDETIFIDGYPGEYICMARRHGDEWHLGAINAGTERTISVKLDFLKQGTYTFKVYEDHPETPMTNIKVREVTASAGDVLQFRLIPNGGFCTVIE